MEAFSYSFSVRAPLSAVAEFHRDTAALKRLSPPPMWVQLHRVDPLGEGSISDFTLWLGPIPIRWTALHSDVDRLHGFTDTQTRGPLKFWRHTHRFEAVAAAVTRVTEHIEYQHDAGWRGLLSRLLFSTPGLQFLFGYRSFVTRRALEAQHPSVVA
jgi:ligand-binding SRPBCC domain-containing protein